MFPVFIFTLASSQPVAVGLILCNPFDHSLEGGWQMGIASFSPIRYSRSVTVLFTLLRPYEKIHSCDYSASD